MLSVVVDYKYFGTINLIPFTIFIRNNWHIMVPHGTSCRLSLNLLLCNFLFLFSFPFALQIVHFKVYSWRLMISWLLNDISIQTSERPRVWIWIHLSSFCFIVVQVSICINNIESISIWSLCLRKVLILVHMSRWVFIRLTFWRWFNGINYSSIFTYTYLTMQSDFHTLSICFLVEFKL